MKNIICIRHGYSYHNMLSEKYGDIAYLMPECFNSPLLKQGIEEATKLRENELEKLKEIDIVLVSPLIRTLQTAQIIFGGLNKNMLVLDILKEYSDTTAETPNKRKNKTELMIEFPEFNYTELNTEEDLSWNSERFETIEELTNRITTFIEYLKDININNICVVGHTDFLSKLIYGKIENLEHCHIYNLKLNS